MKVYNVIPYHSSGNQLKYLYLSTLQETLQVNWGLDWMSFELNWGLH